MTNEKGITLITLIITIIVMLVIAGVALSSAIGDNGILEQATTAVRNQELGQSLERESIREASDFIDRQTGVYKETEILYNLVTSADYGASINYSINGVDDWKIFYKDDINVYIISASLLENSKLPKYAEVITHPDYSYSAYWSDEGTELQFLSGSASIEANTIERYKMSWAAKYPTSTANNAKAAAALLNTAVWNEFVDPNYAIGAIATPTLEMFVASYEGKYGDEVDISKMDENGYYVNPAASPTGTSKFVQLSNTSDTLYFPSVTVPEGESSPLGYWLASPSAETAASTLCTVSFSGKTIGFDRSGCCGVAAGGATMGIRPVVSIHAETKATKNGDGSFTLVPNV